MIEIDIEPVDYWCNRCDSAMLVNDAGFYECILCRYSVEGGLDGDTWARPSHPLRPVDLPRAECD